MLKKKLRAYLKTEGITGGVMWVIIAYLAFTAWWQWYFVYPFIQTGDYGDAFDMIMGFNPIVLIIMPIVIYVAALLGGWIMWIEERMRKLNSRLDNWLDESSSCEIKGGHDFAGEYILVSEDDRGKVWKTRCKVCNKTREKWEAH